MSTLVYQNQPGTLDDVHSFACYFDSLYNYPALIGDYDCSIKELNSYWTKALKLGILDNDPKSNTYLEIMNPQGLVTLLNLPLKYLGKFNKETKIPTNVYPICAYYNSKTQFLHFGVYDRINNKPLFDPIKNSDGSGSRTFREGTLQSFRFYEIVS